MAWWRAHLEQTRFIYDVPAVAPGGHACWSPLCPLELPDTPGYECERVSSIEPLLAEREDGDASAIVPIGTVVIHGASQRLFGCLGCGRTHVCYAGARDASKASRERMTADPCLRQPDTIDGGDDTCVLSGRVLDDLPPDYANAAGYDDADDKFSDLYKREMSDHTLRSLQLHGAEWMYERAQFQTMDNIRNQALRALEMARLVARTERHLGTRKSSAAPVSVTATLSPASRRDTDYWRDHPTTLMRLASSTLDRALFAPAVPVPAGPVRAAGTRQFRLASTVMRLEKNFATACYTDAAWRANTRPDPNWVLRVRAILRALDRWARIDLGLSSAYHWEGDEARIDAMTDTIARWAWLVGLTKKRFEVRSMVAVAAVLGTPALGGRAHGFIDAMGHHWPGIIPRLAPLADDYHAFIMAVFTRQAATDAAAAAAAAEGGDNTAASAAATKARRRTKRAATAVATAGAIASVLAGTSMSVGEAAPAPPAPRTAEWQLAIDAWLAEPDRPVVRRFSAVDALAKLSAGGADGDDGKPVTKLRRDVAGAANRLFFMQSDRVCTPKQAADVASIFQSAIYDHGGTRDLRAAPWFFAWFRGPNEQCWPLPSAATTSLSSFPEFVAIGRRPVLADSTAVFEAITLGSARKRSRAEYERASAVAVAGRDDGGGDRGDG